MSTTGARRSPVSRFFRNAETDEVVVVQPPNLPLWVWALLSGVRAILSPDGTLGTVLFVAARLTLAVWAALELARGDSPFRRVLGGIVLACVVLAAVLP